MAVLPDNAELKGGNIARAERLLRDMIIKLDNLYYNKEDPDRHSQLYGYKPGNKYGLARNNFSLNVLLEIFTASIKDSDRNKYDFINVDFPKSVEKLESVKKLIFEYIPQGIMPPLWKQREIYKLQGTGFSESEKARQNAEKRKITVTDIKIYVDLLKGLYKDGANYLQGSFDIEWFQKSSQFDQVKQGLEQTFDKDVEFYDDHQPEDPRYERVPPSQLPPSNPTSASQESETRRRAQINSSRLRLNEQAALILNADKLIQDTSVGEKRSSKQYTNFATYRNGMAGSGGHIDLTKNFFKNENTRYMLKQVPGHVISSLIPSIKLYKVFFPNEEESKPNSAGFPWRIPFDDVSVNYDGVTSEFQKGALEQLLAGDGRLHGVGIKSFTYAYKGTNPAEVNTNIQANLEIYLQDVRDIVKEIPITKNHPNFQPALGPEDHFPETTEDGTGLTFSYADLIADIGRRKLKTKDYNEHYYRIKAIVGYEEPTDTFLKNLVGDDEEQIKKIKAAIRSATVILYLSPHNHDITFEENGSITIKIEYVAAMTSVMASLNIFETNSLYTKLVEYEESLRQILLEQQKDLKKIKRNCEGFTTEVLEAKQEERKRDLREKIAEAKDNVENNKNAIYADIFAKLVGSEESDVSGKIYSVSFEKEAIGVTDAGVTTERVPNSGIKWTSENLAKAKTYTKYKVVSWEKAQQDIKDVTTVREVKTPISSSDGTSTPADSDNTSQKALSKQMAESIAARQRATIDESDPGKFVVKFVYLGDIIDIASDVINNVSNPVERPRIILTDFTIHVPNNVQSDNRTVSYDNVTLNISDIPISLEMLKNFYLERVVKTRRSVYPLATFITNIITDIVAPAVSPSYFGNKAIFNRMIRLGSLSLSIPFEKRSGAFLDSITNTEIREKFNGTLRPESFINKSIAETSTVANIYNNIGNYFVLYCSNQLANIIKENNGNTEKDEVSGIYHFFVGSDVGFLKKLNFSRTTFPFYKEAKNVNSQGNKSLGRLREVYDVTVNMFGNNIYRPGEYFYIEPLFFTGREAVDLQTKIGLGGYYQVIDVETNINQNIYETTLKGVLYGHIEDKTVVSEDADEEDC